MSQDAINSWVKKAKNQPELAAAGAANGVQVIKRAAPVTKGNVIMDVAEKIRPWLMNVFNGLRDENGLLIQPSRVRAIALNVAQDIVRQQEEKHS
jgi:hypothetical protein